MDTHHVLKRLSTGPGVIIGAPEGQRSRVTVSAADGLQAVDKLCATETAARASKFLSPAMGEAHVE